MLSLIKKWTVGRIHFKWSPSEIQSWLQEGAVIFVTLDCDWLDLWALNYHLQKEKIRPVRWTNAVPASLSLGLRGVVRFFRLLFWFMTGKKTKAPVRSRLDGWIRAIENNEPVLLSFPEGEKRQLRRGPRSEQWLATLLSTCHKSGKKVRLVPYYLFWKRSSVSKRRTLWNILTGSPHDPRAWRKILQFFHPHPLFSFATLDAHLISAEVELHSAEISVLSKQWRRRCIIDLVSARRVLLGPAEKSTDYLMDSLFSSHENEQKFIELASKQGVKGSKVTELGQRYFKEIAASFNFLVLEICSLFLTWLWQTLYTKIDYIQSEIETLRKLNQSGSLILMPCHKSHMDYILLSDLFFRQGIVPPHIAAGVNLSFWPFGTIARRTGAFFIRRTFKGNLIYAEVLKQYLGALLKDRHNIEFFIEGGRSRTGRMLPPKYGLLKMIFSLFEESTIKDASIVPVFIGYDQIIESSSYKKELIGIEKKQESGMDLVRSLKYVRRKYGSVYIRFGEPLSVRGLIEAEKGSHSGANLVLEKTAFKVSRSILDESVVTPSSLLAFSYLNSNWETVHRDTWVQSATLLVNYFQKRGAEFDPEMIEKTTERIEGALANLVRGRLVSLSPSSKQRFFVPSKKRIEMNIYKNHAAHWALIDAAGLLAEKMTARGFSRASKEIRALLKFEYFLLPTEEWERRTAGSPWSELDVKVKEMLLRTFADIVEPYLFGVRALENYAGKSLFEDELIRHLRQDVFQSTKTKTPKFPEGMVVSNFKSLLKYLSQQGVVVGEERADKFVFLVGSKEKMNDTRSFLEDLYKAMLTS